MGLELCKMVRAAAVALVAITVLSGAAAAAPGITLGAATVPVGGSQLVTVVNDLAANPTDWVALYEASAPDSAYMSWQFLNGMTVAPSSGINSALLRFFVPSIPGTYQLRLFSNNTFSRLAVSATFAVPAATLTLTTATVTARASIGVVAAGGPANPTDWVALYRASAADGAYLAWQFMNGTTTAPAAGRSGATLQFLAPATPGDYELRFFSSNTFTRLAISSIVTVTAAVPSLALSAPTVQPGASIGVAVAGGPANALDWVALYRASAADGAYLAWQFLNGATTAPATGLSSATLQFRAPATPGDYELRFFSNNTFTRLASSSLLTVTAPAPTIAREVATVPLGVPIRFAISGGPANPLDWVALYRASTADGAYLAWQFLNGSTTPPASGLTGATLQFMPTAAGAYELRFFSNNTFTRLATSAVTVTNTATVTMTTATVAAAPIKFVVAGGPANPRDWIGLYSTSSADGGYIAWQYLNGRTTAPTTGLSGASLWFQTPATTGTYEVRLFSNDGFTRLATSGQVVVQALPVPRGQTFVSGLASPVGFVQDPVDPTVQFVVEQTGRIRDVKSGVLQGTNFLDLSGQIRCCSEQGLLGLAFPPDYGTSHRFYVSFTGPNGNVVARFVHSANRLVADPASRFDLRWRDTGLGYIAQPFANHNGGNIAFGPDGYLYVARGDGGSANDPLRKAQDRTSPLGKMLRIDVNVADIDANGYVVPADNPFVLSPPTLAEIWAFGLRNPWRFTFDDGPSGTNALVVGDVGQGSWEEIDYELPNNGGRNYGWVIREGLHPTPGVPVASPPAGAPSTLTDPIFEYSHADGISITGGYVYRGTALGAGFRGRYFFADLLGSVWSLSIDAEPGHIIVSNLVNHSSTLTRSLVSAFGRDADGELYIVEYGNGTIVKITP